MQKAKGAGAQAQPCTGRSRFPCELFKPGEMLPPGHSAAVLWMQEVGEEGRDGKNVLLTLTIFKLTYYFQSEPILDQQR